MNIQDKIQQYIDYNSQLVEQYDSNHDNIPLELSADDIEESYIRYRKAGGQLNLLSTLAYAVQYSIDYGVNIVDAYDNLIAKGSVDRSNSENVIQSYFKEVNDIYNKNDNNYDIEYCPENRDKLIEMNLKTVISIAKKYQGLGLDLADLISAGNVGLVTAWEKYDPSRMKIKDQIIKELEDLPNKISSVDFKNIISKYMEYGDATLKLYESEIFNKQKITKEEALKFVEDNIKNAKFNSIAVMWIRAYILIEIDKYSRVVKKPKSEIIADKELHGAYRRESLINIDEPIGDDDGMTIGDKILGTDDDPSSIDIGEAYDTFKSGLKKLLDGVKTRDRAIFLKKFGIGIPRPMTPKEIAEQEELSIARVSQILQNVLETIRKNQVKYNIDPEMMYDALEKFQ